MNEPIFQKRLDGIYDDLNRLSNAVVTMGLMSRQYPENFLEFCLDTAVRAEKIACRFRHLVGDFGMIRKEELLEHTADAQGIEITEADEILKISIPRLLPKQKKARSCEFITQPLYYAMQQYCCNRTVQKFRECVVCFIHTYDRTLSLGRIRDYDNLEMKSILNTISAFFMTDDSGLLCDVYHTTDFGDRDATVICIMQQNQFPVFVSKLKTYPDSISDFSPASEDISR